MPFVFTLPVFRVWGILGTAYVSPIAFAVVVGGGFSPFGDRESQPFGLMFCGSPGHL
jgi:hypothetical protein